VRDSAGAVSSHAAAPESQTKPTGTHTLISKNCTLTALHPRRRHHELHSCQREPGKGSTLDKQKHKRCLCVHGEK